MQVFTLHWSHSLHLPACSVIPFRAAPKPSLRTGEGCHNCLHHKETQYCPHRAAAVSWAICAAYIEFSLSRSLSSAGFFLGNMLYFWHCVNCSVPVYKKSSQYPTFYFINKILKSTRHLICTSWKDSEPGCESCIVGPAADAIVGCICLPCRVAKEAIKSNLSFSKCNIFCFLRTVTLLHVILLPKYNLSTPSKVFYPTVR